MENTVERATPDQHQKTPMADKVRLVFPVVVNPQPKALVVHCSDVRFRKAFRNFTEGDASKGCLGLKEEDYVSLVIPGGVSPFSEQLALPKRFKVAKEQVEFLINHFTTINRVVLINHEDCAAYRALAEKFGSSFVKQFASILGRQEFDLVEVAKRLMGFDIPKRVGVNIYMAKFANAEHAQVTLEEVKLK